MPDEIKAIKECDFGKFRFKRVLNDDPHSKTTFIEGQFDGEDPAVVILEKTHFNEKHCEKMLKVSDDRAPKETFRNDIYSGYTLQVDKNLNEIKATVIYPATPKHIEKYSRQEALYVRETPELYREKVEPFLRENCFSTQWVYNVLEHKREQENVLFEDDDKKLGFMLCKDMKWDITSTLDLHALAMVHDRSLRSLRDLRGEHLPLLRNIREKSTKVIEEKFALAENKLLIYFHYQPSYYHLHIHFVALTFENPPGGGCQRGHLLDTVISNLELCPDYYAKATLCYTVRRNDALHAVLFPTKDTDAAQA